MGCPEWETRASQVAVVVSGGVVRVDGWPAVGFGAEAQYGLARLLADGDLRREGERLAPGHHLTVGLLRGLRAEGRVADQHFVPACITIP